MIPGNPVLYWTLMDTTVQIEASSLSPCVYSFTEKWVKSGIQSPKDQTASALNRKYLSSENVKAITEFNSLSQLLEAKSSNFISHNNFPRFPTLVKVY